MISFTSMSALCLKSLLKPNSWTYNFVQLVDVIVNSNEENSENFGPITS